MISKICTILGTSSGSVGESLGVTKPNRAKIAALGSTKEIFEAMTEVDNYDCEETELLYKQWHVVSLSEARRAKNVDEARMVFSEFACEGTEAWLLAYAQWERFSMKELRRANTLEEIVAATRRAPNSSRAQKFGEKKWDRFSSKEVRAAQTVKELRIAHARARTGCPARRSAIRKIARLLSERK